MLAKWPEAGAINDLEIKGSCYLMEAAHSFRVYLKNFTTIKKPKAKGEVSTAPEKPDKAIIWVAKTFPQWQSVVLTTLKKMNDVNDHIKIYTCP